MPCWTAPNFLLVLAPHLNDIERTELARQHRHYLAALMTRTSWRISAPATSDPIMLLWSQRQNPGS